MKQTNKLILNIVSRATTFTEKHEFEGSLQPVNPNDSKEVDTRLQEWCTVVADGNWKKFEKRLAWDNLTIEQARDIIAPQFIWTKNNLPKWADVLGRVIEANLKDKYASYDHLPQKMPFVELFSPAVRVAEQLFQKAINDCVGQNALHLLFLEAAILDLKRDLFRRLSNLCAHILFDEFNEFRPAGLGFIQLLNSAVPNNSRDYYMAFVRQQMQDGLSSFFSRYPVLAKLFAVQIQLWIDVNCELVTRLAADYLLLSQQVFGTKTELDTNRLGKVIHVRTFLSDYHNGGRSVFLLEFDTGKTVVYKPRPLGIELAFNEFLKWCNTNGLESIPRSMWILNQGEYGWSEYIDHAPCSGSDEVKRYYKKSGVLLALLYFLGANDIHNENLIASGPDPVLVDLETLLHPTTRYLDDEMQGADVDVQINELIWDSVLRTGLLPRWSIDESGDAIYDASGLYSDGLEGNSRQLLSFKNINSDAMTKVYSESPTSKNSNVVYLDGEIQNASDYKNEIVNGFVAAYQFILKKKKALNAQNSPLKKFHNQSTRFIFRPTKVYGHLQQSALTSKVLTDGMLFSIHLERLSRAVLISSAQPLAWSIVRSELKSMEQFDIPYFVGNTDSTDLTIGAHSRIRDYFDVSSYEKTVQRFAQADLASMNMQISIIEGVFTARRALAPSISPSNSNKRLFQRPLVSDNPSLNYLEIAEEVANDILRAGIYGKDNSVTWLSIDIIPGTGQYQYQPVGPSLYAGQIGIALFFAALSITSGKKKYEDVALSSIRPLLKMLTSSNVDVANIIARDLGIGGCVGLGSVVYGLTVLSRLLNTSALLEDAIRISQLIDYRSIAADKYLDVLKGVSGTLIGLIPLYQQTQNREVLDKCYACGHQLTKKSVSLSERPKAWIIDGQLVPLTGFSHGAAGICLALARLYALTQEKSFLNAVIDGIRYERMAYSAENANWLDLRRRSGFNDRPTFSIAWCNGSAGIGLARLGLLAICDTPKIREEIDIALSTIFGEPVRGVDHVCCGTFGRIETMLVASQKLSEPVWAERAREKAREAISRRNQIRGFQLFENLPPTVFSPGFFQGLSGIGYSLLRLALPNSLPSVLLFE